MPKSDEEKWVERVQRQMYAANKAAPGNSIPTGAAMILTGLQMIADDFRIPASATDRKLIRAFNPDATDASIKAHRVNRNGILYLMGILTTAARKYLDHQPETSPALDSLPPGDDLADLIPLIYRGISNSFEGGASVNASSYDVTAALVTNTAREALRRGVAPEQVIMLLLDNVHTVVGLTDLTVDQSTDPQRGSTSPSDLRSTEPYTVDDELQYRPAAEMPIADHIAAAQIVEAVLDSPVATESLGLGISFISSRLSDWLIEETDEDESKMIGPDGKAINVEEIYPALIDTRKPNNPYTKQAKSAAGICAILEVLKGKLRDAYPACEPLRDELGAIDALIEEARALKQ